MTAAEDTYDVVVLGPDQSDRMPPSAPGPRGLSVAMVERELVGGECSYWACVPSKALLRPVIAVADADHVDGAREAVSGSINAAGVFGRRDRYVSNWDDAGQADWVAGIGATLVRGHGRLDGPRRVTVTAADGERVGAHRPARRRHLHGKPRSASGFAGHREARPWTNRKATDSSSVPNRLAVVGAGGVGVEMATAWKVWALPVTLLARGSGLLPRMEPFVGELVERGLRESGVDVRVDVSVTKLRRPDADGPVTLELSDGAELEVDEVLFATGRAPLTDDIGLQTVGLTPGELARRRRHLSRAGRRRRLALCGRRRQSSGAAYP